tara:strand:+ start:269 stop:580 length:312 start_codon:yes stop_codon:yes gene_type:complete
MEEYQKQYQDALSKIIIAVANNKNVILCGPGKSGKTKLQEEIKEKLENKSYDIYYGIDQYNYSQRINGRTYSINKFWIEEQNSNMLASIFEDYEYINLPLTYN